MDVSAAVCFNYISEDSEDKKITGYYAWKDDVENAGAIFIDKPVVVEDNIITSHTNMLNG